MSVAEATDFLQNSGLEPQFEYQIESSPLTDKAILKSSSSFIVSRYLEPESSDISINVVAEPDEDFVKTNMPFSIVCEGDPDDNVDTEVFWSVASVWDSSAYRRFIHCDVDLASDGWEPDEKQQEAIALTNEYSTRGTYPDHTAVALALEVCTLAPRDPDTEWAGVDLAYLKAASVLCEEAPFHKELQAWADEERFAGDILDVGEDIEPGTYETARKVNGCHWYHMDSEGNYYQQGPVRTPQKLNATVKEGDTLYGATECGIWIKK